MLLGIAIGLVHGRKWCDWYCPRGSFSDALISNISPKRKIPFLFKNMYFRLTVLSVLMLIMTLHLVRRWSHTYKIGMFFITLIIITTGIGIILAIIFHQRSLCMICPIGTVVNLIGRNRQPLKIDSDLCLECKLCAKVCPVQLKPYIDKGKGMQILKEGDCLKCGLCIAACPTKALKF